MKWPRGLVDFWIKLKTDPVACFTAVIAAVTTVYVIVSIRQLIALEKSNEGAQRAWVLLAPFPKDFQHVTITPDTPFTYKVLIENTGNSPATKILFTGKSLFGPIGLTRLPPEEELYRDASKLPPSVAVLGSRHTTELPFYDAKLTQDQIGLLIKGTHVMYFVGKINYADQFSDSRRTRFCVYWAYGPPDRLGNCSTYNEAT